MTHARLNEEYLVLWYGDKEAPKMKRHRPEPHIHRFILPPHGARVKGVCSNPGCGAVKVFENLFVLAPRFAFGHENRSKMLEMMANERRAARAAVLDDSCSLAEAVMAWGRGEK